MATAPNIPALGDPHVVPLPGGVSIGHRELVDVVQPALTPLAPMFTMVDAVLGVFDCVKAVTETLSMPPDPTALVEAIAAAGPKVARLLGLVPPLSLVLTVVGLIDLLIATLERVCADLAALRSHTGRIAATRLRATQLADEGLAAIADSADADVGQEVANALKRVGALEPLVGTLNRLLQLANGPTVSGFSNLAGGSIDEAVNALQALIRTLREVRAAIPV